MRTIDYPTEFFILAKTLSEKPKEIQCFAFAQRSSAEHGRFRWYNFKRSIASRALRDESFAPIDAALAQFELIIAPADGISEHKRGRYSGEAYKSLPRDLAEAWAKCEGRKQLEDESQAWGLFFRPRSLSPLAKIFGSIADKTLSDAEQNFIDQFNKRTHVKMPALQEEAPTPQDEPQVTQIARGIIDGTLKFTGTPSAELQAEIDRLKGGTK